MKPKAGKMRSGLTLIEVMVAMVVIVVGVLGAMMYRYHTAFDARKADLHMGATRIGLLLLEEWKGMSGATYDPTKTETDLIIGGTSPDYTASISGGTGAGYHVVMPQPPVTVNLNGIDMNELKVTVYWSAHGEASADNYTGKVTLKDWAQ